MKTIFDDVDRVIIRNHGSFTTRELYPASHYDGKFPDAFKGGIEPPAKKSKVAITLKLIVVVMLALIIIKVGGAILSYLLPYILA